MRRGLDEARPRNVAPIVANSGSSRGGAACHNRNRLPGNGKDSGKGPPMSDSEQPLVFVHLLPDLIPPGALSGGVAVVVDVLRATTMMVHALSAGCVAVIPCGEIDEARRVAAGFPPGEALLAGERQGLPIDGFDLGNSPDSCTRETCRGKTLVMTTTNGTRAVLASLDAERVVIGAFPNFAATALLVHADRRPIHVVCSGTDRCISYEDSLLAGAFA